MVSKATGHTKKPGVATQNPLETLKSLGSPKTFTDQILGDYDYDDDPYEDDRSYLPRHENKPAAPIRKEFSVFSAREHHEAETVRHEIGELTEQIKQEIVMLKRSESALAAEVKDIEKITLQSLPDKPGIYHVRFLEIVLSMLRVLRQKIGESGTWFAAMISKKKKRGSAFAVISKKKGTQYSMSQELQASRAVQ